MAQCHHSCVNIKLHTVSLPDIYIPITTRCPAVLFRRHDVRKLLVWALPKIRIFRRNDDIIQSLLGAHGVEGDLSILLHRSVSFCSQFSSRYWRNKRNGIKARVLYPLIFYVNTCCESVVKNTRTTTPPKDLLKERLPCEVGTASWMVSFEAKALVLAWGSKVVEESCTAICFKHALDRR